MSKVFLNRLKWVFNDTKLRNYIINCPLNIFKCKVNKLVTKVIPFNENEYSCVIIMQLFV